MCVTESERRENPAEDGLVDYDYQSATASHPVTAAELREIRHPSRAAARGFRLALRYDGQPAGAAGGRNV